MASAQFNVGERKFYDQYRHGDAFTDNLGEFTTTLKGNEGEIQKLIQTIGVRVEVNRNKAITVEYKGTTDPTFGVFIAPSLNWMDEGLWDGALVDIEFDGQLVADVPISIISGRGYSELNVTKALLTVAGIRDGFRKDFVFKLKTAPRWLTYKYGLNAIGLNTPNYISPFDNNEQAYYIASVPNAPTLLPLRWKGNEIGSDLGTVNVTFEGTVDTYTHEYTIEHVFLIPYYREGEVDNLADLKSPKSNSRPVNVKYGNGFFFGGTTSNTAAVFEDIGGTGEGRGSVGYMGQNFDGKENFYETLKLAIANSLNTEKIEVTTVNTVTFSIKANTPFGFVGGEEVILTFSKLPTNNEAKNQQESFDGVWVKDSLRQTEGDPAAASTIITNFTVTLNLLTLELDVVADVRIPPGDEDKFTELTNLMMFVTIATQDIADPDNVDRANVPAIVGVPSKDTTVSGLVTDYELKIFEEWDFNTGLNYTNFSGWNGDFLGLQMLFKTDVTRSAIIKKAIFRVVSDDYPARNYFPLFQYSIPINAIVVGDVGGVPYQVLIVNIQNDFNIPAQDELNRVILESFIPVVPGATQQWAVEIGFQVPWREWIQNLAVPPTYVDTSEPNNNRNEKSSNYSILPDNIKTVLSLVIESTDNGVVSQTEYDLVSDNSNILDFDDPGAGTFSAVTKLYDLNGDPSLDILTNQDMRVEIEFTHALGIIPLAQLHGYIWAEPENGIGQPWYLSTDRDFTDPNNLLQASNVVTSTNNIFVEVKSVNNLVTLICETNKDNFTAGGAWNIYGRLGNKL